MNRQQRRLMQRQGQLTEDGSAAPPRREEVPERRPTKPVAGAPRTRPTVRQFLHEVNVEMRKVAWPTRSETANYATVVFITLAILMALIFALDLGFSKLAIFLFK